MKNKHLITTLILLSAFAAGSATVSQADLNERDFLSSWVTNESDGIAITWDVDYFSEFNPQVTKYKIYKSPVLSLKDYLSNKNVKYEFVTDIDPEDKDYFEYADDESKNYLYTFDPYELAPLKNNEYYRFKIEAYYGKKLVCTDYCEQVGAYLNDGGFFSPDLEAANHISGKKTVISWDKKEFKDKTFTVYLSDAVTSYKDDHDNVSYHEYGKVSGKKGKYTIKGLEPGKDYYCYIAVYKGKKLIRTGHIRIGSMPAIPDAGGFEQFSTKQITVPFYLDHYDNKQISPDGFIVYRKNKKGKFVKVADIKKPGVYFIDKNVEAGRSYTYKARSYKKINGKTYYSVYSDEVRVSAVNKAGKFKISFDGKDKDTIKVESSDKNNGTIRICEPYFKDDSTTYNIEQYSIDGSKWIKTDGTDIPELKAGKTIRFKLAGEISGDNIRMCVNYGDAPFYDTTYYLDHDFSSRSTSLTYAIFEEYCGY